MNEKRFREKLSGRVRFPEDTTSKNMIHGGALRSPYPSGIIEEIELPELPEDCFVIDYDSITGSKQFQLPQGEMPLLAHERVTYRGEPILLVGAPNPQTLHELLTTIRIKINPEPELPPLSLDTRENVAYERQFYRGEAEEMLEREDLIRDEDFYTIESQAPTSRTTPHVSCQREGNRYIIHSATQWPSMVRKNTAACLKIRRDQILLRNYPCENSQDSRLWNTAINACHAALLCQKSRRTVRFLIRDEENEFLLPCRGKTEFYIRGAQTTEGDIQALKVDFVLDVGAYGMLAPEIIDRMVMACTGVYQCRHLEVSGVAVKTNHMASGFFPDMNLAPVFFAVESFVNNLSRSCGISPLEWKERNLIRKGNLFLGAGQLNQSSHLVSLIDKLMKNSDFKRKEMSYQLLNEQKESISTNNESFHRGMAFALAYTGNDFLYNHTDMTTATVRGVLDKDGVLTLYLPVQPGMNRLKKTWALRACEILGLKDSSQVNFTFDQERMNGGPSLAGRNVSHLTRLIELCCEQIQKKRFRDPLPIDVTRRYSRQESRWNRQTMEGTPYFNMSWGGAAAEVEIDQETFNLTIKKLWLVLECGLIADEPSARTAVERGLYQAMDTILGSSEKGTPVLPPFEVDFLSSGTMPKGLDGLVQSLVPPAVSCAVSQAAGKQGYSLPLEEGLITE